MHDGCLGLLRSLQHSDSFFPSGATAFSWGLEALHRDHLITDTASLTHHIETQLLHRWTSFDQSVICAAWQVAKNLNSQSGLAALFKIDDFADAMTLSESTRAGSRKLGKTLVTVHVKLGTASALQLQQQLLADIETPYPHLSVTQGYLWAGLGMSELEARAISAHSLCTSATSAALRLGLIGHIDAQRILVRMHGHIAEALMSPAPTLDAVTSATLATDIATLRHGEMDARMFVN